MGNLDQKEIVTASYSIARTLGPLWSGLQLGKVAFEIGLEG